MIAEELIDREKGRLYQQIARAQDAGLPATLTLQEWLAIIERFQGKCAYCQINPFNALDHLHPLVLGGGTTAENCVPSCTDCNGRKWRSLVPEGFQVKSFEEKLAYVRDYLNSKEAPLRNPSLIGKKARMSITFPIDLMESLQVLAERDERSLNSELIWLARQYVTQQFGIGGDKVDE